MPQYLSPGVYVEEVPSAVQAIAGVSTSTAGFIGKAPDAVVIPPGPLSRVTGETISPDPSTKKSIVKAFPVREAGFVIKEVWTEGTGANAQPRSQPVSVESVTLKNDFAAGKAELTFKTIPPLPQGHTLTVEYDTFARVVRGEAIGRTGFDEQVGTGDGKNTEFFLSEFSVATGAKTYKVYQELPEGTARSDVTSSAELKDGTGDEKSKVVFKKAPAPGAKISVTYQLDGDQRFPLASYPVTGAAWKQGGTAQSSVVKIANDFRARKSELTVTLAGVRDEKSVAITADYEAVPLSLVVHKQKIGVGDASTIEFPLAGYPVDTRTGMAAVRLGNYQTTDPDLTVKITNDPVKKRAVATFATPPAFGQEVWADYVMQPIFNPLKKASANGQQKQQVKLCTSFSDFRKHFGDFSADPDHNTLTHAVYGFFHNGGSRCYVGVMDSDADLDGVLTQFAAIDEIALVAYPGMTNSAFRDKIVAHCAVATQDRFAIFDSPSELADDDLTLLSPSNPERKLPDNSNYAAFYFPWIQVFDPVEKTMRPKGDGRIYVPPSGHMAGIYARVDNARGVHKAPANEVVLGALGLKYNISKAQQDGLNPQGVNCIRDMNGNIRVWGARTIGGDANGEWRYVNVRRSMLFLRESIDEGLQWAVFEPNDMSLWAKITRNVSAFLTTQWHLGMLFGSTAQEAFYVKCDAETNPPELREIGQVVTEIGVAIVRPAEFVIFRISQWQPTKGG